MWQAGINFFPKSEHIISQGVHNFLRNAIKNNIIIYKDVEEHIFKDKKWADCPCKLTIVQLNFLKNKQKGKIGLFKQFK